jgi:hypothetical protein
MIKIKATAFRQVLQVTEMENKVVLEKVRSIKRKIKQLEHELELLKRSEIRRKKKELKLNFNLLVNKYF